MIAAIPFTARDTREHAGVPGRQGARGVSVRADGNDGRHGQRAAEPGRVV